MAALLPRALRCRECTRETPGIPEARCHVCGGALEAVAVPSAGLPTREEIARRAPSLWRYREWLPFDGQPRVSLDSGFTPLVEAPRIAARLGVARCWIKNDSVSHPTLSFKDRVVTMALNAAVAFGMDTVGCASTGNLAHSVAAHAARAGLDAWVFIPDSIEQAKVATTQVFGPNLVRVAGTYDDVNRLCAEVASAFGWGIVNVNLRPYYGEGSKTMAFEIVEQLGWRLPTAVVAPMAGGSLISKLRRGFAEFIAAGLVAGEVPRLYGAQADGCAPIARAVQRNTDVIEPEVPHTIARSIAIGNPADGAVAARAVLETGGHAAAVSDEAVVAAMRLLAEESGIFPETAGGATVAAALVLAEEGRFRRSDEVVLCITGNGLKTLDPVLPTLEGVAPIPPTLEAVRGRAGEA